MAQWLRNRGQSPRSGNEVLAENGGFQSGRTREPLEAANPPNDLSALKKAALKGAQLILGALTSSELGAWQWYPEK